MFIELLEVNIAFKFLLSFWLFATAVSKEIIKAGDTDICDTRVFPPVYYSG